MVNTRRIIRSPPPLQETPQHQLDLQSEKPYKLGPLEWGFVMCCIGDHNPDVLERRIEEMEAHLDRFPEEFPEEDVEGYAAGSDYDFYAEEEVSHGGSLEGTDDVVMEIPVRIDLTSGTDDERGDANAVVKEEEPMQEKRSRSMPRRKCSAKVTEIDLTIESHSVSDSASEFSEETPRQTKRQKVHNSDRARPEQQRGPTTSTDSMASFRHEPDTIIEITSPGPNQDPADRAFRPSITIGRDGRVTHPFKRSRRVETTKEPRIQPYVRRTHKVAHIPRWPGAMMCIGPTDNPRHGITLERAIKMVEERARINGLHQPTFYATFFAQLFSSSSMENILRACRRYCANIVLPPTETQSDPFQAIEATMVTHGIIIGNALHYHRQAVFVQKLTKIHDRMEDKDGEIWKFIERWALGTAGRAYPGARWANEVHHFVIEKAGGLARHQVSRKEWKQKTGHFSRMCRLGKALNALRFTCSPAICLMVGAMSGEKTHSLQHVMKPEKLRDFVDEILQMLPKYPIATIRLLSLDLERDNVRRELEKKTVRYRSEFDDDDNKVETLNDPWTVIAK
ncbi:MAG: hypothetical protein Q9213_001234 [Squamulea squamosa]